MDKEKRIAVELHFFRAGRFVGASFCEFSGTEAELEEAFGNGKVDEGVVEFMANLAKVRKFDTYRMCGDIFKRRISRTEAAK